MRSQDKRRIEAYWAHGQTPEQAAWAINIPVAEVRDIFAKLDSKTGATS